MPRPARLTAARMADDFDPLVPRPLDEARAVPLDPDADLALLDSGKILAAPDDPADWGRWRDQLARWRAEARERLRFDDALYDARTSRGRPGAMSSAWSGCGTSSSTIGAPTGSPPTG